jgi:hypothetical protein
LTRGSQQWLQLSWRKDRQVGAQSPWSRPSSFVDEPEFSLNGMDAGSTCEVAPIELEDSSSGGLHAEGAENVCVFTEDGEGRGVDEIAARK